MGVQRDLARGQPLLEPLLVEGSALVVGERAGQHHPDVAAAAVGAHQVVVVELEPQRRVEHPAAEQAARACWP